MTLPTYTSIDYERLMTSFREHESHDPKCRKRLPGAPCTCWRINENARLIVIPGDETVLVGR